MTREHKNFERALPAGFKEDFHIDARKKETAIALTVGSLAITAVVFILCLIPLFDSGVDLSDVDPLYFFIFYGIFIISMLGYIVLHELTHGLVYKIMTGEKLTFGITPAAAFCGVPKIYTYKKCALFAIVSPLVLFTLILAPMVWLLSYIDGLYYIGFSFILALHLGGCIGDGYLAFLLLTRYKDKEILMKDTGPEQFIYVRQK